MKVMTSFFIKNFFHFPKVMLQLRYKRNVFVNKSKEV